MAADDGDDDDEDDGNDDADDVWVDFALERARPIDRAKEDGDNKRHM